jgi:hypothetical protein
MVSVGGKASVSEQELQLLRPPLRRNVKPEFWSVYSRRAETLVAERDPLDTDRRRAVGGRHGCEGKGRGEGDPKLVRCHLDHP